MAQSSTYSRQTIILGSNSIAFVVPEGKSLRAIETPAGFEGTTLTFQGTGDPDGVQSPLYDGASLYSVPSGVSRLIPIPKPELFQNLRKLTITSNVAGTPSNVLADRILVVTFGSA